MELRTPQKECLDKLREWNNGTDKIGLVQMFCGTGKTHIFLTHANYNDNKKVLIVFPTLMLLNKQVNDYLCESGKSFQKEYKRDNIMTVCCENELEKDDGYKSKYLCATDVNTIRKFVTTIHSNSYIICTYKSLDLLFDNVEDNYFDICIYDEGHRFTKLKQNDISFINKGKKHIVFTATPKQNGLWTQLNNNIIYKYRHLDAVKDNVVKDFEIVLLLRYDETISKEELLSDTIYGYYQGDIVNKWLSFHSRLDNVNQFYEDHENAFGKNDIKHYKISKDNGIILSNKNASYILKSFEQDNGISLLSSCNRLSEGLDIKAVSGIIFADVRKSNVYVTQAIGRCCRKYIINDNRKSIVLLPLIINKNEFNESLSAIDINDILRKKLKSDKDWSMLVNICMSILHENPEFYHSLIDNPITLSQEELINELSKNGFHLSNKIYKDITELLLDFHNNINELDTSCLKSSIFGLSKIINRRIIVISDNIYDDNIDTLIEDINPLVILFFSQEKEFQILSYNKDVCRFNIDKSVSLKRRQRKFPIKILGDKSLITFDIEELCNNISVAVLDLITQKTLQISWEQSYLLLLEYVKIYKSIPVSSTLYKGVSLGRWCCKQRARKKMSTSNDCLYPLSEEQISKLESIECWWWDNPIPSWNDNYNVLLSFINKFKRLPKYTEFYNEIWIGKWCQRQRYHKLNPGADRSKILTQEQISLLEKLPGWFWTNETVLEDFWDKTFKLFKSYVETNNKLPPKSYKTDGLGDWLVNRKNEFKFGKLDPIKEKELSTIDLWKKWADSAKLDTTKSCKFILQNGKNIGKECSRHSKYNLFGIPICDRHFKDRIQIGKYTFFIDNSLSLSDKNICETLVDEHLNTKQQGFTVVRRLYNDSCLLDGTKGNNCNDLTEYNLFKSILSSRTTISQ